MQKIRSGNAGRGATTTAHGPALVGVSPPSLMAKGLFKAFIRLRHFSELAQIRTNMPFEPNIVIHPGGRILVLSDQLFDADDERSLIVNILGVLQRATHPFLSRSLVEVVPGFVTATIGGGLIQPRRLIAALQPFADHRRIPGFRRTRHLRPHRPGGVGAFCSFPYDGVDRFATGRRK